MPGNPNGGPSGGQGHNNQNPSLNSSQQIIAKELGWDDSRDKGKTYEQFLQEYQQRGQKTLHIARISQEDTERMARGLSADAADRYLIEKWNHKHSKDGKTISTIEEYEQQQRGIKGIFSRITSSVSRAAILSACYKQAKTSIETERDISLMKHGIEETFIRRLQDKGVYSKDEADQKLDDYTKDLLASEEEDKIVERIKISQQDESGNEEHYGVKNVSPDSSDEIKELLKDQYKDNSGAFSSKQLFDKAGNEETGSVIIGTDERENQITEIAKRLKTQLESNDASIRQQAQDALDKYLESINIVTADVSIGLAAKESYVRLSDKRVFAYGVAGLVGGAALLTAARRASKVILPVIGVGVVGGITAYRDKANKQRRENVKDALDSTAYQKHEGDKDRFKIEFSSDIKTNMEALIAKINEAAANNGKTKAGEKIDDLRQVAIEQISNFRAKNRIQNEEQIQLIGYNGRENIEQEKLEMFETIFNIKKALCQDKNGQIDRTQLSDLNKDITAETSKSIEVISRSLQDVYGAQKAARIKAAFKGATIAAVISGALSFAPLLSEKLGLVGEGNPSVDATGGQEDLAMTSGNSENITELPPSLQGAELVDTNGDGNLELVNQSGEVLSDNIEVDPDTGRPTAESLEKMGGEFGGVFSVETQAAESTIYHTSATTSAQEYLNNPDSEHICEYQKMEYTTNGGTASWGEPIQAEDGYYVPIYGNNLPDDAHMLIDVDDKGNGKALIADIITDDNGNRYAVLPANTALSSVVQDGQLTGTQIAVGTYNPDSGAFTSYGSQADNLPSFSGELTFDSGPSQVEAATTVLSFNGVPVSNYELQDSVLRTVPVNGDTELNLKVAHGGYNRAADPYFNKIDGVSNSAYGNAIEINVANPEVSLEQWVENIQKSPDQLVWNSVALQDFESEQSLDDIMKSAVTAVNYGGNENWSGDWRTELGITGAIDTEEEVNAISNIIAQDANSYEQYKKLFVTALNNRISGGTVEIQDISEGGRYSSFDQANQYMTNDPTGSMIRAARATTGGHGLVLKDQNGNSIFDEAKMNKLLKVQNGQAVSNTMIRLDCGGQTTKVIESYGNAPATNPSATSDVTASVTTDTPVITTEPPIVTTEPPITTEPPVTTKPAVVTTEPPITTEPPVTTQPVVTTEPPVTTQPAIVTTEAPVTTHPPHPHHTTEPPIITTEPPIVTTEPPIITTKPPFKPKDRENMERIDEQINEDIAEDIGTQEVKVNPTKEVSKEDLTSKPTAEDYQGTEPHFVQNKPSQVAEDVSTKISPENNYSENRGAANQGGYKPVQENQPAQEAADKQHANDQPATKEEAANVFGF